MKKKYFIFSLILLLIVFKLINLDKPKIKDFKHENYIKKITNEIKSVNRNKTNFSNKAPYKYLEEEYINEMNPKTGKPDPEKLFSLQEKLNKEQSTRETPGTNSNSWIERGPNNVPGRTRAMLYDPNDPTHKRVFAGGVTGGLWVINNIEDNSANWQSVGIPENLSVSCITTDINDSNIMYVGTGEPYAGNKGNGVWKSTDGGNTWSHIFGGTEGETIFINDALATVNTPSNIALDYLAIKSSFGPEIPTSGITGNLVLANDVSSTNPTEGCADFGSTLAGEIAIIDRGSCDFTVKVKNAQESGASAVVIIQSVVGFPFSMGGTDDTINIPAVMISKSDGDIIKNEMQNGNVNLTISPVTTAFPAGANLVPGKFFTNDIVTRNNNDSTEIYVSFTDERYYSGGAEILGGATGLFKSTDGGTSWSLINLPLTQDGNPYPINDLLITSDNNIWAGTINSTIYKKADDTYDGGGKVFMSTDGNTFTQKYALVNGNRVQIASSSTNPNKLYLLIYTTDSTVELIKTVFGFNLTPSVLTKPDDPTTNPTTDFTNGQGWYDLAIAVDPNNDDIVYVGGNNLFKSTNAGSSWTRISHYYENTSPGSYVHVDQHSIVMHPTDSNKGLVGNDGGVYYVSNWGNSQSNANAITSMANEYNTTQFYKAGISQSTTIDKFIAGAQDNGTQFISDNSNSITSANNIGGGDGMYCFIDADDQYMIRSVYQNAYFKLDINGNYLATIVNNQNEGSFVNIAELDDKLDILFSNASVYSTASSSWTVKISRFTNISGTATRTDLSDAMLKSIPTAMKVSPYSLTTTLFVGTQTGEIIKIENANSTPTWTDLTPEPYDVPFIGSISSINFGANPNEILVTFHNYGVVNIYFSEDGGVTWQNKEGDLPDLPVKDILMNPLLNDEVIIATDLGVWKTSNFKDANPHWVRSQNGMQNVKVTSFDLRTADNTILASTYGRGLFTGQFTATPTSTNDFIKNNNKIEVYPTISSGLINVKSLENYNDSTIQIFDINGKKVYNSFLDINSNSKSIDLSINQGVYFVNISNGNLKESHKIIIK